MKFRTSLNMDAVQEQVQSQLDKLIDAGIPMVYEEDGRVIEVKVLKTRTTPLNSNKMKHMTAAE